MGFNLSESLTEVNQAFFRVQAAELPLEEWNFFRFLETIKNNGTFQLEILLKYLFDLGLC